MSGVQRLTLAGLLVLALGVGLIWGLRSQPPTETEVIDRAAADYVAETGGVRTDCAARPAGGAGIWLVVICADGRWARAYDRQGRVMDVSPEVLEEAPRT
jgi:hypothetical protein